MKVHLASLPNPTPKGRIRAPHKQYPKQPCATSRRIFDATANALSEYDEFTNFLRCFEGTIKPNRHLSRS